MDVLKQSKNQVFQGLVLLFVLTSAGCHNKEQIEAEGSSEGLASTEQVMVSFPKIVLRLEHQNNRESKLAELDFNFYGKDLVANEFEVQKDEIRNLILIHFANSDFEKIPEQNLKIKDPKLSAYLNQFISKGTIEDSEYKLVRIY